MQMMPREVLTKVQEYGSLASARTSIIDAAAQLSEENYETNVIGKDFNLDKAWKTILNFPDCVPTILSESVQKEMGLEVGVNVSEEFPWKQVKYKTFLDAMSENSIAWTLMKEKLENKHLDDMILVGYAPILLQQENHLTEIEGDPFIIFGSCETTKYAMDTIKNIEAYENWVLDQQQVKQARRREWANDDRMYASSEKCDFSRIEFQSIYPIKVQRMRFEVIRITSARDSYVQLIPENKDNFLNILRNTVDVSILSTSDTVTVEQQTDPTFPKNTWAQYFYEVVENENVLDVDDEGKTESAKQKTTSSTPIGTPIEESPPLQSELSDSMKRLLTILELNLIDVYRNDYPTISRSNVPIYVLKRMADSCSYFKLCKTLKNYVLAIDWFPSRPGTLIAAFGSLPPASYVNICDNSNDGLRSATKTFPVLMWNMNNSLDFELEFVSSLEITCLSLCPYDENILVGGTRNGLIILWDLQDRMHSKNAQKIKLTRVHGKQDGVVNSFLEWAIVVDERVTLQPAAVSRLDPDTNGPIVRIKWLDREYCVWDDGKICKTAAKTNRFFVTTSLEGCVAFWNLDVDCDANTQHNTALEDLPEELKQRESTLKKCHRLIKPLFMISHSERFLSSIFHGSTVRCTWQQREQTSSSVSTSAHFEGTEFDEEHTDHQMVVGTMLGQISLLRWYLFNNSNSTSSNEDDSIKDIGVHHFYAEVHDGPVFGLLRSHFYSDIFASIGRSVLAIWKEGFKTPIFWRKRPTMITSFTWSPDRPAVLILSRDDGVIEVWDFFVYNSKPCLVESVGGGIITTISAVRSSALQTNLCVADYNGSIRIIVLPDSLSVKHPDEAEIFRNILRKEYMKKSRLKHWEKEWSERKMEVVQAAKTIESQIGQNQTRFNREANEFKSGVDKKDLTTQKKGGNWRELIAEEKWHEKTLQRHMKVLINREYVDDKILEEQSLLEKNKLKYMKNKSLSMYSCARKLRKELKTVRTTILPAKTERRSQLDVISQSCEEMCQSASLYQEIKSKADFMIMGLADYNCPAYHQLLQTAREWHTILNLASETNEKIRSFRVDRKKSKEMKITSTHGHLQHICTATSKSATDQNAKPI